MSDPAKNKDFSKPIDPPSANEQRNIAPSAPPYDPLMLPPKQHYMALRSSTVPYGDGDDDSEDKCCRICLESDNVRDMIAPCRCSGSSKWVHRECLDLWRVNEQDRAFSKCTECLFEYRMQAATRNHHWKRAQFCALVSRDFLLVTLLWQAIIGVVATIVYLCDTKQELVRTFAGDCLVSANNSSFWCHHTLSIYYMSGVLVFLVLLGLTGSIVLCSNGCSIDRSLRRLTDDDEEQSSFSSPEHRAVTYRQRRRHGGGNVYFCCSGYNDPCCYCPFNNDCCCVCPSSSSSNHRVIHHHDDCCGSDCDCCNGCNANHRQCDCGDSNDGAHILLLLLLVVAVILAIIGFIVGVVLAVIIFQRVVQRHLFLLQKRRLVQDFVVMDLANLEAATMPSAETPLVAPSAPPAELDDDDRSHLQKLGLMDKK